MIVLDFSGIAIASMMINLKEWQTGDSESRLALLRHMILNSIRATKQKFRLTHGEVVIACDGKGSWRTEAFPYYKANRKRDKDASLIDWKAAYQAFDIIKDEINAYLPYRMIEVERAEADDVIASLCRLYSSEDTPVLIVSRDRDFFQLQSIPGVSQWDPIDKRNLVCENPRHHLLEKIIRGDTGDGVPNFLSPDDSFVSRIRQKPILTKNLDMWLMLDRDTICDTPEKRHGWDRNKKLVDLSQIPETIPQSVKDKYESGTGKPNKAYAYIQTYRLRYLSEFVNDF